MLVGLVTRAQLCKNVCRLSNLVLRASSVPSRGFNHQTFVDIKEEGMVEDGMGFSFIWTVLYPNCAMYIDYKCHLEAVMCVKGECEVENVKSIALESSGEIFNLLEGTMYALGQNESHHFKGGREECHMICVYSPPHTGEEILGPDGSSKLLE
eukprot:GFUD01109351.1.p1 GENE.GFUD01109351.1~~GFUD01109351.1.p1  ORF type:complete len:163 (-),score=38.10 GFUD01109351.1:102-560(-)